MIPPPSNEKSEVDALSASCIEDEEKEEVEALSASCIEDGEEDDMFAVATQEQAVVDETADDTTVENVSLDNNTAAEERVNVSSFVPDSMGLLEQETAPLNGEEEEEGMVFHKMKKQEAERALCKRATTPKMATKNDSALLGADTQTFAGQPNESSLLFGEPTQVLAQ